MYIIGSNKDIYIKGWRDVKINKKEEIGENCLRNKRRQQRHREKKQRKEMRKMKIKIKKKEGISFQVYISTSLNTIWFVYLRIMVYLIYSKDDDDNSDDDDDNVLVLLFIDFLIYF